eukprot:15366837-Ditylum_brightwellii.AAC.2
MEAADKAIDDDKSSTGSMSLLNPQFHKADDSSDEKESGNESNETKEQNDVEYVQMGRDQDHFTFINDVKATSDTTNSKYDFINITKATKKDTTVDTSGNDISDSIVGDVKETICSNAGHKLMGVNIKDMVHMPGTAYNLFSLTKCLG